MPSYPLNPPGGIPTAVILSPATATLQLGNTLQLAPTLADPYGNPVTPTQQFKFVSSNPALLTVSSSGLCTAAPSVPNQLQTGGMVTVTVTYPFGNGSPSATIGAVVTITVTVPQAVTSSRLILGANGAYVSGYDSKLNPS